jgi:hypothetical protein
MIWVNKLVYKKGLSCLCFYEVMVLKVRMFVENCFGVSGTRDVAAIIFCGEIDGGATRQIHCVHLAACVMRSVSSSWLRAIDRCYRQHSNKKAVS